MTTGTVAVWSVIGGMAVSFTFSLLLPEAERTTPANTAKGIAMLVSGIFFTGHLIYLSWGATRLVEELKKTRGTFYLLYGWMMGGYCAWAFVVGLFAGQITPADRFAGIWGLVLIGFVTLEMIWAARKRRRAEAEEPPG